LLPVLAERSCRGGPGGGGCARHPWRLERDRLTSAQPTRRATHISLIGRGTVRCGQIRARQLALGSAVDELLLGDSPRHVTW